MNINEYARAYTERYGFHLVPIEPGRKFPTANDWGNQVLTDPDAADRFYTDNSNWNMGVALGPSSMCSLDIDCAKSFNIILDEFGIPHDALDEYPTIQGSLKGRRVMFRVPDGMALAYAKLNWPKQDGGTQFTVFELRAACDGKQRQDVLPPSYHETAGKKYQWLTKPPKAGETWPEPPGWLLAIWEAWDNFKPQLKDACPWAVKQPAPAPVKREQREHSGVSVIDECLAREDLRETLRRFGYKQIGRRWLSPHSTTGLPGVTVLPDGQRCFIHHASDPLCSEESGKPVNAFDLICYYEHSNDTSKAVKALSKEYGMEPKRTVEHAPAVAAAPPMLPPDPNQAPVQSATTMPMQSGGGDVNSPLIFTTDKGKPKKHIANLREICRRLGVTVRYNEISKEEEILIPNKGFSRDNEANASLAWLKSECSLYDYPADAVQEFVTVLADENQFNPVRSWVMSKAWDGVDRAQALFDTVQGAQKDERSVWLKEQLIKRWSISAIAGAFQPNGVSAGGVLVFQGAQYLGKTKWFKTLVPQDMNLIKDGMLLRPDDKDSVKQITSFWMVELGELDSTFRRADIAALKAFITKDSDTYRKPYAKRESNIARRTVFFGSVNPKEFLHDITGNRRYWTIECESLDHSHDIDMQQYWAQIYEVWKKGESHFLTPDEMDALNDSNDGFMAAEPVEEKILSSYDWSTDASRWRWISATDVLQEVGNDRPGRADVTTAAMIIRRMNNDMGKRQGGQRLLLVPPKKFTGYQ